MTEDDGDDSPKLRRFNKRMAKWVNEAKKKDSNVSTIVRADGRAWSLQWIKGKLIARLLQRKR
jgi:hypothetical protein